MMTSRKAPYCSDEELLKELKKLGYNDLAPDVFQLMKEDISELVEEEQYPSEAPIRRERKLSSSTIVKYSGTHSNYEDTKAKYLGKSKPRISAEPSDSSTSHERDDDRYAKYRNRLNAFKIGSYDRKFSEDTDSPNIATETSLSSSNYSRLQAKYGLSGKLPEIVKPREPDRNLVASVPDSEDPLDKYRQRFKLGAFAQTPDDSISQSSKSVASSENKMKRKVLRRRDGKPVVTEEYLDMPSIFNTSYPETESGRSFSSDDLSFKSNGSTGSIVSPEMTTTTVATQSSFSTPRSIHTRIANQRKKKTDPVAMYNYYKKYWNNFKPPGEKTHDKLRWAVRDRMLDYNL